MPGELGNEEFSNTPGYYEHRYEHRTHYPDGIPKPKAPGLNKKIMDMARGVVKKHPEDTQSDG